MELEIEGLDRVEKFIKDIDRQYQFALNTPVPQEMIKDKFIEIRIMKLDEEGLIRGVEVVFIFKKRKDLVPAHFWELTDYKIPESSSI